jgi:hypothetical protein
MTCDILKGYISGIAKNCIPNPPSSEMCEVCVPMWNNGIIVGLVIGVMIIGLLLLRLYLGRKNE